MLYDNQSKNSMWTRKLTGGHSQWVIIIQKLRKDRWAIRSGEQFMLDAMIIAPRMAKRDLIMASTFIYLVGKEEKICL